MAELLEIAVWIIGGGKKIIISEKNYVQIIREAELLERIRYCNSLLVSLPGKLLNQLQAVINTAARLVCHAMKANHITPVLKDTATNPGKDPVQAVSLRSSVNIV